MSNPYGLRIFLLSSFIFTSHLAIPSLIASACPISPHPLTTISASYSFAALGPRTANGYRASSIIYACPPKYSSKGTCLSPLRTVIFPFPFGKSFTTALEDFLLHTVPKYFFVDVFAINIRVKSKV